VAKGSAFYDHFERRLPYPAKVYAAGVGGYGTAQEYLLLRRLQRLKPDVVVWQLCNNDIINNVFSSTGRQSAEDTSVLQEGVTIRGTRKLLDAVVTAGAKSFIFFSSVKAFGESTDACLDETSETHPTNVYGQAKIEAEKLVLETGRRQGLKVCCPEEIAYRMGYITDEQLKTLASPLGKNAYGQYLLGLLRERVVQPLVGAGKA
jgi:hypothetical protein